MRTTLSSLLALLLCASAVSASVMTASLQGLGDPPAGAFSSKAYHVSSDGSTIVGYGNSASGQEAFHWTIATGLVGLGDFPGGSFESAAQAVSSDGSIVVGWGNKSSGKEAFRW